MEELPWEKIIPGVATAIGLLAGKLGYDKWKNKQAKNDAEKSDNDLDLDDVTTVAQMRQEYLKSMSGWDVKFQELHEEFIDLMKAHRDTLTENKKKSEKIEYLEHTLKQERDQCAKNVAELKVSMKDREREITALRAELDENELKMDEMSRKIEKLISNENN